jgi:hypothetical protein
MKIKQIILSFILLVPIFNTLIFPIQFNLPIEIQSATWGLDNVVRYNEKNIYFKDSSHNLHIYFSGEKGDDLFMKTDDGTNKFLFTLEATSGPYWSFYAKLGDSNYYLYDGLDGFGPFVVGKIKDTINDFQWYFYPVLSGNKVLHGQTVNIMCYDDDRDLFVPNPGVQDDELDRGNDHKYDFTILKRDYDSPSDVTAKTKELIDEDDETINATANTLTFGDPFSGQIKEYKVTYYLYPYESITENLTIAENVGFTIPSASYLTTIQTTEYSPYNTNQILSNNVLYAYKKAFNAGITLNPEEQAMLALDPGYTLRGESTLGNNSNLYLGEDLHLLSGPINLNHTGDSYIRGYDNAAETTAERYLVPTENVTFAGTGASIATLYLINTHFRIPNSATTQLTLQNISTYLNRVNFTYDNSQLNLNNTSALLSSTYTHSTGTLNLENDNTIYGYTLNINSAINIPASQTTTFHNITLNNWGSNINRGASSTLVFNDAVVNLSANFDFGNSTLTFQGASTVDGASLRTLTLGTTTNIPASQTTTFQNVTLSNWGSNISRGVSSTLLFDAATTNLSADFTNNTGKVTLQNFAAFDGANSHAFVMHADGELEIPANEQGTFKDVTVNGLGLETLTIGNDSSQINFQDTTINLGAAFNHSAGILNLLNANTIDGVDGKTLTIGKKINIPASQITTFKNITLNNWQLDSTHIVRGAGSNLLFNNATANLSSGFTNDTGKITMQGSSIFDGANSHAFTMAAGGELEIPAGEQGVFQNATINGLGLGSLNFGNAASDIKLNNTTVNLGTDFNFSQGVFSVEDGDATIDGGGKNIYIVRSNAKFIPIDQTLTFKNANIVGLTEDNIGVTRANFGSLIWDDVTVTLSGDWYMNANSLTIRGNVQVKLDGYDFYVTPTLLHIDPGATLSVLGAYESQHNLIHDVLYRDFTLFKQGFVLRENDSAYLALEPAVHGDIELQNGTTLNLDKDLILAGNTIKVGSGDSGSSTLRGYLHFNPGVEHKTISLLGDLTIVSDYNGTTLNIDDITISGGGNNINLESKLQIASGGSARLENCVVNGVNTNTLGAGSELILENTILNLDGDFDFSSGDLTIKGTVIIAGPHKFTYSSIGNLKIEENSTLYFDHGTTFEYNSTTDDAIRMDTNGDGTGSIDPSRRIYLNDCSLDVAKDKMQLKHGTLILSNKVNISTSGYSADGDGLIFGQSGYSSKALTVQVLAGTRVINNGCIYDN